jgi:hypothetical protein
VKPADVGFPPGRSEKRTDERGSSHRDDPLIGSMMRLHGGYYGVWFVDVPWLDAKKRSEKRQAIMTP